MTRITDKQLQAQLDLLNELTNSPSRPWSTIDGKHVANIGCFCFDHSYGGIELRRIMNTGGGESQPLGESRGNKRETYERLNAFIAGISLGKKGA